jgi:pyruvate formate lyase activating enzyme
MQPELSYRPNQCIGKAACGYCADVCSFGAVTFAGSGVSIVDREVCTGCFRCVAACPSKARKVEGDRKTADEILDSVEQDAAFYKHGDGGLTLSGGEPLMQGTFLLDLLKKAKERRLHTAMETCGYGDYATLNAAAHCLDVILFDIKSLNREKHIAYTGKSNELILRNFEQLCSAFPTLDKFVRTPVIPGFNDTPEDLREISTYLRGRPGVRFETLPYHRLGEGKYRALGRPFEMGEASLDASWSQHS